MALHTTLDLYAAIYDLLNVAADVVVQMRRDAKRIFGEKIIDACIKLDLHLRNANMVMDAQAKEPHLLLLLEGLEEIELLIRMCCDKGWIDRNGYGKMALRTQSIGRQTNGLRRHGKGGDEQLGLFPERQGAQDRASI